MKIELRRRIALGAILSLSIFTIITSIVRIGGGKSANGQIDSSWVVFWLQVEASVAVIVISVSAYRALYVAERSRKQESPKFNSTYRERLWSHSKSLKTSNKGTGNLPSVPNPTLSGVRTYIERAPVNEGSLTASQDKFLPPNDQSILVTKELSSHKVNSRLRIYEGCIDKSRRHHPTKNRLRHTKWYNLVPSIFGLYIKVWDRLD